MRKSDEKLPPSATMVVKTPRDGYYAVRFGKGVRSCVFFNWEDCKDHVAEGGADYKVFDSLEDAAAYATSASLDTLAAVTTAVATEVREEEDCPDNENKRDTTPEKRKSQDSSPTETAAPRAKKCRSVQDKCRAGNTSRDVAVSNRLRQPTKKWESMFDQLKRYQQEDGTLKVDDMDEAMRRWIRAQDDHYRLFRENRPCSMFEEKVKRLSGIGFTFRYDQENQDSETPSMPRKIYKQWADSCLKLKEYMGSHGGSWDIDLDDNENSRLRHWIMEQHCEFRRMQEGNDSSMTEEKLRRLKEIGVEFQYVSWHERIRQLQTFKEEHGHLDVPLTHEELGKWVSTIRKHYKAISDGRPQIKQQKYLTVERIDELTEMGFVFQRSQNMIDFHDDFEECFKMLEEYKRKHGDCLVKRYSDTSELHNWVARIRKDYKKLQEGKHSRITVHQLQRLTDIGFIFRQKDAYLAWEDRFEELQHFKAKNGHLNVTTKHPELGEFVGRQRKQYKKRMNGQKSPMTDARIAQLTELGFDFQVENWRDPLQIEKPKTWEERFQELLEFKGRNGHTIVPQKAGGLGSWVKKQRKDLKAFRRGLKGPMTAEKALRLSDIGFVIDVFEQKKLKKDVYYLDENYG